MKRLGRTILLSSILTLSAAIGHAQPSSPVGPFSPVQAKLVVPDPKALPGVPLDMWIEVRNPSDAAVGVGLCPHLTVRSGGTEPFEIGGAGANEFPVLLPGADGGQSTAYLLLSPGETRTLTLPAYPRSGATFFDNDRISAPGRYVLSVRLDYCWGGRVPQESLLPPTYLGAITTNEVAIERIQPTGSDAKVWQRMQEITKGHWIPTSWTNWPGAASDDGIRFVTEVVSKHPDSNYVPYALLAVSFGNMNESYVSLLLDAIKKFPNSPTIELLHWRAAGAAQGALNAMTRDELAHRRPHDAALAQRLWNVRTAETTQSERATRPTSRVVIDGHDEVP